jgi:hypothetical protein
MRGVAVLRSVVVVSALLSSSGCYGYFASAPEAIQPGEQIRVVLSNDARRFSPAATPRESYLDGDLLTLTPDSAALSVWVGQSFPGTRFETAHQTVMLPREQIVSFQRRELSEWRTMAAAAAVIGVAAALISQVGFEEDPNAGGTPNPPPPPPGGGSMLLRAAAGLRLFIAR